MFEIVMLLKSKKTGRFHCPFCIKELKDKGICWECEKCKKYYGKEIGEEKGKWHLILLL